MTLINFHHFPQLSSVRKNPVQTKTLHISTKFGLSYLKVRGRSKNVEIDFFYAANGTKSHVCIRLIIDYMTIKIPA